MKPSTRKTLLGLTVVLFIGVIVTQRVLDPQIREIHANEKTMFAGLSNEFILGPLLGLQQAIAGVLWVRADEFFHEGDYDAILPIVRMVTWLDPHSLDVYITGAWHLAYNFTDSSERSDRRYIPAAQKLLEEGVTNNPQIYDIAFEAGWQNHDKIKDYARAEYWFREALKKKRTDERNKPTLDPPMFVTHMLAHSLDRQARVDDNIEVWRQAIEKSEKLVKAAPDDFTPRNVWESEKHNWRLNLLRKWSRYVHRIHFDVEGRQRPQVDPKTGEPTPKDSYIATDAKKDGVPVGTPRKPAVDPPWDVAFDTAVDGKTTIKFDEPMQMDIRGQMNIADGARVVVRLHDDNWRWKQLQEFTFDIDLDQTIMQDQLSVRAKRGTKLWWGRKIDMHKDPKMYSFSRDHYYLVLEFNPRQTSPFIQDRIGWSGEGMTDKKYLWVVKSDKPGVPDNRIIRKVYRLSRDQIYGERPVTEKDVVPNAEYARLQEQQVAQK